MGTGLSIKFPQGISSLRTGMARGSFIPCGNNFRAGGHPSLREKLREHRCPYTRPGLTGSSGLPRPGPPHPWGLTGAPLSDPPNPGLTGSLGLTSPLQLWQKNRCCGTAAAASAIFPPAAVTPPRAARAAQRGPALPVSSSAPRLFWTMGIERDRAVPSGGKRLWRPLVEASQWGSGWRQRKRRDRKSPQEGAR